MFRIELTIDSSYCPSWGLWEGVREFVQNWMDARDAAVDKTGHVIAHLTRDGGILSLANPGATLNVSQLALVGSSTKRGKNERGQFGEGLKIGMLALVRMGHHVVFYSGDTEYYATLEPSQQFEGMVLCLRGRPAAEAFEGVAVQIRNVPCGRWASIRSRFLFDREGPLLKDHPGQIFVRDIFVQEAETAYGYNLPNVNVDRDRRLVGNFDLKWNCGMALAAAQRAGVLTIPELYEVLRGPYMDADHAPNFLTADQGEALANHFAALAGPNVIPVSTEMEMRQVEHGGLTGMVTPKALVEAIGPVLSGRYRRVLDSWEPVPYADCRNADWAAEQIPDCPGYQIVSFKDPRIMGRLDGGQILVSLEVLDDRFKTLKVFVEETAHLWSQSGDGSLSHKHAIHDLYLDILRRAM